MNECVCCDVPTNNNNNTFSGGGESNRPTTIENDLVVDGGVARWIDT